MVPTELGLPMTPVRLHLRIPGKVNLPQTPIRCSKPKTRRENQIQVNETYEVLAFIQAHKSCATLTLSRHHVPGKKEKKNCASGQRISQSVVVKHFT